MNKAMSIYRVCLWAVLHLFICLGINSTAYAGDVSFAAETSASAPEASSSNSQESKVDVTEKTQALPATKPAATNTVKTVSNIPAVDVSLSNKLKPSILAAGDTNQALRVILGLTVLAILPAILVSMTAFLRIIIVLSMLRHAIGMQETPPNSALIGLALFLTLFTMAPTLQTINDQAFQPFMSGKMDAGLAYEKTSAPMRDFMVRQTREQDLALMVELSKSKTPETMDDIGNLQLIPAFMLSELRASFQIGFVIFLPFLLIDLIVSSILMALGMMMMPPISIALPLKILMFVLIDGWSLVLKALVGSFH
ncbi:flagellar type III secretion system pore protein FliP [Undibacterium sp. Di27W]|uniref:flagellar type III secretion system pore protein FliP n=1 Tax=Undibacterium sp. Di27W TaxID=3413036 RepID=UPI003BEF9F9D